MIIPKKVIERTRKYPLLYQIYVWGGMLTNLPFNECFNLNKIRLFSKIKRHTLVTIPRLNHLYNITEFVNRVGIKGNFVECGVWKGGCSAIMAFLSYKNLDGRTTWLFDSFEGLPEPRPEDGLIAKKDAKGKISGKLVPIGKDVANINDVNEIMFSILKLNPNNIRIISGWFQNTIPKIKAEIDQIAILRLDADWYESTKFCLDNLYDLVAPGGFVVIDDYGKWKGCRKAMDEFIRAKKINRKLIKIDSSCMYFQKC